MILSLWGWHRLTWINLTIQYPRPHAKWLNQINKKNNYYWTYKNRNMNIERVNCQLIKNMNSDII
jgi:hypothetical protein